MPWNRYPTPDCVVQPPLPWYALAHSARTSPAVLLDPVPAKVLGSPAPNSFLNLDYVDRRCVPLGRLQCSSAARSKSGNRTDRTVGKVESDTLPNGKNHKACPRCYLPFNGYDYLSRYAKATATKMMLHRWGIDNPLFADAIASYLLSLELKWL